MTPLSLVRLAALVAIALGLPVRGSAQVPEDQFRVGDRILLRVETDSQLSDTFTVSPGPALVLPVIGNVPLAGVPRAEVERYLAQWIGRFLRDPVVRAQALLRLSILGEVTRPGFYAVPADAVLADAMMAAGGPTKDARFAALRIEREGTRLWSGGTLQEAIARGQTLEQMGVQSGDRIIVPGRGAGFAPILGILLAIPTAIYAISQITR
jgi:polysaccharide biosynthesis/export protein